MSPEGVAPHWVRRFVPTLTEVVVGSQETSPPLLPPLFSEPAPPAGALPAAAPPPAAESPPAAPAPAAPPPAVSAAAPPTERELGDAVLARLGPDLDRIISQTVARVLHEQMLGFNARVQKAVAEAVREAVAKSQP